MPTIIISAHDSHGDPGTVTLAERAIPVDLHNQHYMERLIERVAWALRDAEKLESRRDPGQPRTPRPPRTRDAGGKPRRQARNRAPASRR